MLESKLYFNNLVLRGIKRVLQTCPFADAGWVMVGDGTTWRRERTTSLRKRVLFVLDPFLSCASLAWAVFEQKLTASDGAAFDEFG